MSAQRIIQTLNMLAAAYRQPLGDDTLAVYVEVLLPFGAEAVDRAARAVLADADAPGWFPRTQEIILRITGSRKLKAEVAWTKFRGAISTHIGRTVAFDDPLIHHVAVQLGGWRRLGENSSYANDQLRADFVALYGEAFSQPPRVEDIPRRLLGNDDPPEGKAVLMGDRDRALDVLRGDLAGALGLTTGRPAPLRLVSPSAAPAAITRSNTA